MSIPDQFSLRDWINYFLIGLMILLTLGFYIWHFFGIDLLGMTTHLNLVGTIILFASTYLVGQLLAGISFSYLLKISVGNPSKPQSRVENIIRKIVLGLESKTDGRIAPFEDSKDLKTIVEKKISSIFSLDAKNIDNSTRREIFYIVMRHVEYYSEGKIVAIERFQIKTNLFSSIVTISLIVLALNTVALLLKITQNIGEMSLVFMIIIEFTAIVLLRISSNSFQKYLLIWWKNIWRSFFAISINPMLKEKISVKPKKSNG